MAESPAPKPAPHPLESSRASSPQASAAQGLSPERPRGFRDGLHWTTARTLYNVDDALAPERPCDVAPGVARALRHAGPGAARALFFWLLWLDLEPLLSGHARQRFWRLPRGARRAALERWEASRWARRRRAFARLRGWLAEAHSSDGA